MSTEIFQIENDIPVTPRINNWAGGAKKTKLRLTIEALEIGQSFVFPIPTGKTAAVYQKKAANYAAQVQRATKKQKKFTTRLIDGGVRVWRIEPQKQKEETAS